MYMFIVLSLVVYLLQFFIKQAKTVRLQDLSMPFCGVLNELKSSRSKYNTSTMNYLLVFLLHFDLKNNNFKVVT